MDTVKFDSKILSSSHINFLFGAGVNGTAFPQIYKFSKSLELLKHLNMTLEDVVAIGDNYNDLPMLEIAGVGCAVNNALAAIKEKCSFVSEFNNNESAVADVIERFVLNR